MSPEHSRYGRAVACEVKRGISPSPTQERPAQRRAILPKRCSSDFRSPPVQPPNQTNVPDGAQYIYDNSERNQRGAEPRRDSIAPQRQIRLANLQGLKEQAEARDHEAETHQRKARSNSARRVLSTEGR